MMLTQYKECLKIGKNGCSHLKKKSQELKIQIGYIVFVSVQENPTPSWWGDPDINESSYLSLIKPALNFLPSA